MEFAHVPVMWREVIENLRIRPDGIYADGTLGGGGHASLVAERLSDRGRLIGVDQDADAIQAAGARLAPYGDRVTIVRANYEELPDILAECGAPQVDGILLDLGVSSYQLDNPERGFSYHTDAPLDMRMNQDDPLSAAVILNTWDREELIRILRDYGEEKCAVRIADGILRRREEKPLETTGELADIVYAAIPAKMRRKGGNPCKRTFQAVRIACNRELEVLENSVERLAGCLAPGGRLCIITFHSLEDRIVKNAFRKLENPCICPPEFPVCVCGRVSMGRAVTRKAILPSEEELAENHRAASAKLRVFERAAE